MAQNCAKCLPSWIFMNGVLVLFLMLSITAGEQDSSASSSQFLKSATTIMNQPKTTKEKDNDAKSQISGSSIASHDPLFGQAAEPVFTNPVATRSVDGDEPPTSSEKPEKPEQNDFTSKPKEKETKDEDPCLQIYKAKDCGLRFFAKSISSHEPNLHRVAAFLVENNKASKVLIHNISLEELEIECKIRCGGNMKQRKIVGMSCPADNTIRSCYDGCVKARIALTSPKRFIRIKDMLMTKCNCPFTSLKPKKHDCNSSPAVFVFSVFLIMLANAWVV
eukprot:Platyproteum_vivax@DN16170_c0_g1_i1.p1